MDEKMKCPYCGQPMICGQIHGAAGKSVCWLPDGRELPHFMSERAVEELGGFRLGKGTKLGAFSIARPQIWVCKSCEVLVSKYSEYPNLGFE